MELHGRKKNRWNTLDLAPEIQDSTPKQRHNANTKEHYKRRKSTANMYKGFSGVSPPPSPTGYAAGKGSGLTRLLTRDSQGNGR
jgi:hypothetical protein